MSKLDSYNNVPSEIWCSIFQQLSQSDLFECQKVCKSWYLLTCQYFWEIIQLKTVADIESFLKRDFPKSSKKFVKILVIGDEYFNIDGIHFTLSKEQMKKLLFNLPNLEEIYILKEFVCNLPNELNDEELLRELRESCPKLKWVYLHAMIPSLYEAYGDIMYSLRDTVTKIGCCEDKLYQQITDFQQLKELYMGDVYEWPRATIVEFFNKIKMLPQLKLLSFNMYFNISNEDVNHVLRMIEKDEVLQGKLASLEKLRLGFRDSNIYTNMITQYFIGLKEIDISYHYEERHFFSNEWADFIFSHNKYRLYMYGMNFKNHSDVVELYLKKNFIQNSVDNKNLTTNLWIGLDYIDCDEFSVYYYDDELEFGTQYSLLLESKEIGNNQVLNLAKIFVDNVSEDITDTVYEILNSTKHILEYIDTLTFEFTYPAISNLDYNFFRLIGQVLSMATDTLKKVIIKSVKYCNWNKYFVNFEKVKTYRQVSHLELYLCDDNGELINELTLFQFTAVFPCIKYLTLEYPEDIYRDCNPECNKLFINLPQISLKRLTLDITFLRLMLQFTTDDHFILKVETEKGTCYYQISLNLLNVIKLTGGDQELNKGKSFQVDITLKNIECIELYFITNLYIDEENNDISYIWKVYNTEINKETFKRRIYFE